MSGMTRKAVLAARDSAKEYAEAVAAVDSYTTMRSGFPWADRELRWLAISGNGTHFAYGETPDEAVSELVSVLVPPDTSN